MNVNFQKKILKIIVGLLVGNSIVLCCCLGILFTTFYIAPKSLEQQQEEVEETKEYAPTISLQELPKQYSLEQAKEDGCVVVVNDELISGMEQWFYFVVKATAERNGYIRIATYDKEDAKEPIIRDVYYKKGRYILETQDGGYEEFLYLNYNQLSSEQEHMIKKSYYLSNQDDILYSTSECEILRYEAVDIHEEESKEEHCIVVENGIVTEGFDLWITYLTGAQIRSVRIVTYEDENNASRTIDVGCFYVDDRKNYLFHEEDVGEILAYEQIFFEEETNTIHYVLSSQKLTYDKWDNGFREDFAGYVRNILTLQVE